MTDRMPTSRQALWSAGLFLLLVALNVAIESLTDPLVDVPRPWYDLALVWLMLAAAIMAAVLARLAILRDHDRAALTFVALAPAIFVLVFMWLPISPSRGRHRPARQVGPPDPSPSAGAGLTPLLGGFGRIQWRRSHYEHLKRLRFVIVQGCTGVSAGTVLPRGVGI